MDWSGVVWTGVEWSGVDWSEVEWGGVDSSGVEWSGVWTKYLILIESYKLIDESVNFTNYPNQW